MSVLLLSLWAAVAVEPICHFVPVHDFEESGVSVTVGAPHVRNAMLERVADAMGISNVPVVLDIGEVRNAWSAWTQVRAGLGPGLGDPGVRTLGLSRSYLADARDQHGTWAEMFILAHELGHHVEAHRWSAKDHEAQADTWATRTLVALGASRLEVQAGLRFLASESSWHETSLTHPTPLERVGLVDRAFLAATDEANDAATAMLSCERARCTWEVEATFCRLTVQGHEVPMGQSRTVRGKQLVVGVTPRRVGAVVAQTELLGDDSCASASGVDALAMVRGSDDARLRWGSVARRDLIFED
jgi:hypothetical protein